MKTVRIYGKALETWRDDRGLITQIEYAFNEYGTDGVIRGTGSEDFQPPRDETISWAYVWTWDGSRRQSGGKRWFDLRSYIGFTKYRNSRKDVLQVLHKLYPEAVEIRLRYL